MTDYSFPVLSGPPDVDGWHNAKDHALIPWDDTHFVAIYSGPDDGIATDGALVRMVEIGADGTLTPGPATTYVFWDDGEDYWYNHNQAKVGNLIVQWRQSTDALYTMTYDDASNTFTLVDKVFPPFHMDGDGAATNDRAGRIVVFDDTTIMLVKSGSWSSPDGQLIFGRWSGTSWQWGALAEFHGEQFGTGADYMEAERCGDATLVLLGTWGNRRYGIATGAYPEAPLLHVSTTPITGATGFYNREWFAAPQQPDIVLRAVPLFSGTTTPIPEGSGATNSFDWGIMPLTISGGEVAEGSITNVGSSTGYYNIAATQTVDGATWVVHEVSEYTSNTVGRAWRAGVLEVRNTTTGEVSQLTIHDDDNGIYAGDYSILTLVPVGNWAIVGFRGNYNQVFGAGVYGHASPALDGDQTGTRRCFIG